MFYRECRTHVQRDLEVDLNLFLDYLPYTGYTTLGAAAAIGYRTDSRGRRLRARMYDMRSN